MTAGENYLYATMIVWYEGEAFSEVVTMVFDSEGNVVAMAVCKILNEYFDRDDPALLDYEVSPQDEQMLQTLREKTTEDVITFLTAFDSFLKSNIYDYGLADYGFKSF